MSSSLPKPRFFATAGEFRRWLEENHATAKELYIGFYKKSSGHSAMTYEEAVDEALCFGWIDGIIRKIDEVSYQHRFSPRKPRSIWSNVNVQNVARLTQAGRMHPAGLAAFAARQSSRVGIYSFEQPPKEFSRAIERIFRADKKAWQFWMTQPPGYRRRATSWVLTAKQQATRDRRLTQLVARCAARQRI